MGWMLHTEENEDGSRAIYYRYMYLGQRKVVPIGVRAPKNGFKSGNVTKGKDKDKINVRLKKIESIILTEIRDAKNELPRPSPGKLYDTILRAINERGLRHSAPLSSFWMERIKSIRENGMEDHAVHHEYSRKKIMTYLRVDTDIRDLTNTLVKKIEAKLNAEHLSQSTIYGILHDLRAVLNLAVAENIIDESPMKGYRLPTQVRRRNVALTKEELQAWRQHKPTTIYQELIRDMFIFRYRCLGMRISDQLNLKVDNLKANNILDYTTSKTGRRFVFQLPAECVKIVKRYKGKSYLFPILTGDETPRQLKNKISRINTVQKRLAKKLNIDKPISTHVARHTFAKLNRHLNSFDLRDALGHASITTTEGYADSLEDRMDDIMKRVKK